MKSRKFVGCLVATVLLVAIFFVSLAVVPGSITPAVIIFAISMVVTIWFAYIGGNVWAKWVKSKHFQPGLQ